MASTARQLLRSTPMRLTLVLVLLFAVVSFLSLGASYLSIRSSMDQALRDGLEQELAGLLSSPSAEALGPLIAAEAAVTDPEHRLMSYVSPSGVHYGNEIVSSNRDGFEVVTVDGDEIDSDWPYLALTTTVHGGQLIVASSQEQIGELGALFLKIILISLVPTTLLALAGGVLLARRSGRRIDALAITLDRLTTGDLTARVPDLPGRNDDLSDIAARVDRMAEAQQASVSALKQVSADIAHDLKTPIQRVAVLLSQARETPGISDDLDKLIDRATDETQGIVATFQSLLQIAQIEGGSPKSRFAPVDLGQLATTFVELYAPDAENTGHSLSFMSIGKTPAMVHGDKGLLGQLVANLIENALRHTPANSAVLVSVERTGPQVILSVADNGPGIPEAERSKVLRRLYRLEQSRTTPGNGLGLSLVAVIADLHEGKLSLGSNFPGLRVTVSFGLAAGAGRTV